MKKKTGELVAALKKQLGDKFTVFNYEKEFALAVFKGTEITEEQLAKINHYALETQTADTVYVRKFLACHNMIDRDNERFTEPLLDDYAKTFPGKSFLIGHDRRSLAKGLVFEAVIEEMSAAEFKALTNEKARLPEGLDKVKVLFTWVYFMKIPDNESIMANLDGGVYRHVSIGFSATDIIPVKEDPNGPILYWEFIRPGESLELSLVFLGAQNGATSQKQLIVNGKAIELDQEESGLEEHKSGSHKSNNNTGGDETMDKKLEAILKAMSEKYGKFFTADNADEVILNYIKELSTGVKTLTSEKDALQGKVDELTPFATMGKTYKAKLVGDYVAAKTKLGEAEADNETSQKSVKDAADILDITYLETEVKQLQARVEEKFPSEPKLKAGDDKRDDGKKNSLIPDQKDK